MLAFDKDGCQGASLLRLNTGLQFDCKLQSNSERLTQSLCSAASTLVHQHFHFVVHITLSCILKSIIKFVIAVRAWHVYAKSEMQARQCGCVHHEADMLRLFLCLSTPYQICLYSWSCIVCARLACCLRPTPPLVLARLLHD